VTDPTEPSSPARATAPADLPDPAGDVPGHEEAPDASTEAARHDGHEEHDEPYIEPPLDVPLPPPSSRRYPSTIGGAFYIAILISAGVAIGIVAGGDWRAGVRVLAVGLAAAGLFRLLLPQQDAGMLAVRHRAFDVLLLAGVAGVLWWLAGSIPDQPSP
jgi:hypothetical protein